MVMYVDPLDLSTVKESNFENPIQDGAGRHLEKSKNHHISQII